MCSMLFLKISSVICASSEILLEYEELFNRFWGNNVANNLLGLFETSDNFEQVLVHFNWQLISKDDDDNKFIDTYIAVGADLLISNDSSITSLKANVFPPFNILTLQEFSNFLNPQ